MCEQNSFSRLFLVGSLFVKNFLALSLEISHQLLRGISVYSTRIYVAQFFQVFAMVFVNRNRFFHSSCF